MALNVNEMRERRSNVAKQAHELLNANADKEWTSDLESQYQRHMSEMDGIDSRIKNVQRLADLSAEKAFEEIGAKVVDVEAMTPREAFNQWSRRGLDGMTAQQAVAFRNTMSTTTTTEGGYTVPSMISSQLIDSMKAYGAMRAVSTVINTSDGRPLSFPTSDGTAEVGEWIAQNVTATGADPSFGTVSLNVFKASSKIVAAPIELLQDSAVNIEELIVKRFAERLGRITNTGYTVGTGTSQPDGIVAKASSGKVGTTGQTLTIIYDDLVDLVHSVDPAYRSSSCGFMCSDSMLKVLRKLKDGQNRPIWTPNDLAGIRSNVNPDGHGGYSSQGVAVPFDTLLGYPVWVNNDMAAPGANAKSLIFGDFSKYYIRDAMDVQMFRFSDSAYTKLGQVGFLAWMRTGGNLLDTGAVKFYAHSAT